MSKNETLNKNQHNCPEVVCEQRKRWNQNHGGWGGAGEAAGRASSLVTVPHQRKGNRERGAGGGQVAPWPALGGCCREPGHRSHLQPCTR